MKNPTHVRLGRCLRLAALLMIAASAQLTAQSAPRPDLMIAEFEGETYGDWRVEGTAFGSGPAHGTLPRQMKVAGFLGRGLANSFHGGDKSTGQLTSPEFVLARNYVTFLIGGGGWANETCLNLVIDGKVVRTATGPNTRPGGSEDLAPAAWDVSEFAGRKATIVVLDRRTGGWGHINVDHLLQSDTPSAPLAATAPAPAVPLVPLAAKLVVNDTHLLVPVANYPRGTQAVLLGIYAGDRLVQNFTVSLPHDDEPSWLAAYPLEHFHLRGQQVRIAPVEGGQAPAACRAAFARIRVGPATAVRAPTDYTEPYRNQFHASALRGWNNDPNGLVYHHGKYHLYFQHNPLGIFWGNMHWGHFESADLIHWEEQPIALHQKTVQDMAYSGGGFVDFNNSAGLGRDTPFLAYTSTGRGECLAYSRDGGITFTELPENPVVRHKGRDPKVIWHQPGQKWVMVVYGDEPCPETAATPQTIGPATRAHSHLAFWESKNLRQWTRTGAFTAPDRTAVYECPELFELPISGAPSQSRWVLLAAQNRYFIGAFDGQTFRRESGPLGSPHGVFYAAQTFSDVPDQRRIQIGWVRTDTFLEHFPTQVANQSFTLPHVLTLRNTSDGLRLFFSPVQEVDPLRAEVLAAGRDLTVAQANSLLQKCVGELTEVQLEFASSAQRELRINGLDASFSGRRARIFTDRTFNEIYADDGLSYEVRKRPSKDYTATQTGLAADDDTRVSSLQIHRLKSIWHRP